LPVGNDIVDLAEEGGKHHPRFPRRIFSDAEFEAYQSLGKPEKLVWEAWTAKEAAYKYLKQSDQKIQFLLDQYIYDPKQKTVVFDSETVHVTHEVTKDYVFCRAGGLNADFFDVIEKCEESSEVNQSDRVRLLASNSIDPRLNAKFEKTAERVPYLLVSGSKNPMSVSFTHHGRFVAATLPSSVIAR